MTTAVEDNVTKLRVGNAPCSWGTLEFDEAKGEQITFDRMLDELAETGYTGTELGDWGYMPTDPVRAEAELEQARTGDARRVRSGCAEGRELRTKRGSRIAVKTARLLAAVAAEPKPYLVLADNNGTVPERTRNAGRITPETGLTAAEWRTFAAGANKVGAGGVERNGIADRVPPSLRGLRRDAGRNRAVPGADRSASDRAGVRHRPLSLRRGPAATWWMRSSAFRSASGTST